MKKTESVLDLADIDVSAACDEGFELELEHPTTRKKLGVFVKVLGRESGVFRKHVRDQANRRLREQADRQRRGKRDTVQTIEEIEENAVHLLAICTIGWRTRTEGGEDGKEEVFVNTIPFKGEELAFSVDNAKRLYTEMAWIRGQVDEAIGDLENFLGS